MKAHDIPDLANRPTRRVEDSFLAINVESSSLAIWWPNQSICNQIYSRSLNRSTFQMSGCYQLKIPCKGRYQNGHQTGTTPGPRSRNFNRWFGLPISEICASASAISSAGVNNVDITVPGFSKCLVFGRAFAARWTFQARFPKSFIRRLTADLTVSSCSSSRDWYCQPPQSAILKRFAYLQSGSSHTVLILFLFYHNNFFIALFYQNLQRTIMASRSFN